MHVATFGIEDTDFAQEAEPMMRVLVAVGIPASLSAQPERAFNDFAPRLFK